ncbi:ArsR/SmtB family transcription factor [Cellulomonas sp. S1-8]|uniref:ArsR/SmtB family transcription factor n=1 Tax=Cellulomonas sp. S1-8 TaxID=2904790 RepID=UPI0022433CB9|nr:metalloregulator ArsR/SmtB family transcription factor [Cellulomonas sp. S1-8]UZN04644.1 helix-turn-helix domain-containing protein [Cellulomonas sp. S1-8]
MVVDQRAREDREADRLFHALADGTRRDILRRVLVEGASVSALAAPYAMSFAAVQKHVAVLEQAQLVVKERRGREQIVRGDVATVRRAADLLTSLEELWRSRVERMSAVLVDLDVAADAPHPAADVTPPARPAPERRDGRPTGGTS